MPFMELQLVRSTWVRWDNVHGEGCMVDFDLFTPAVCGMMRVGKDLPAITAALADYTEGEPDPATVQLIDGWCGRYSAPGYLDCTDWCGPFDTRKEAREETIRLYGNEDAEGRD